MPVNSGSSAFGIYFDLVSRGDRELLVTGIRAASSAGLNDNVVAGKKMDGKAAISVRVYSCTSGSGKGKEDVEGEWELLGEDKTVSLPVVSWADPFAGYGILPQLRPIRVPPGGTVGVCVRTDKVGLLPRTPSAWPQDARGAVRGRQVVCLEGGSLVCLGEMIPARGPRRPP